MANFDLSKLMEGKNPQQVMLAETRELKAKWDQTGLLEGLGEREQSQISVLLENQAKQLLDEATSTGTSAGSEEWSGVALPLVRRIFGEIASKEFVSVQPMNLPSGLIFYLDFKYGTNGQAGRSDGAAGSLFGGAGGATIDAGFGQTKTAENGLYGDGAFGYTVNETAAAGKSTVSWDSASLADVNFDSSLSASIAAGELAKVEIALSDLANADADAVRSFRIADADISDYYPAHTSEDGTNVTFIVKADGVGDPGTIDNIYFSEQPVAADRGDFEARGNSLGSDSSASGFDLGIPEVDLELKSDELTSMLSEYISLEIDLEILDMLKANALTTEYWSVTLGEEYDSIAGSWIPGGNSAAYTKNSWFQTLGAKLNKVSNKIHQLTLRGGANFVVASPDVCTILESIPGFTVSADKDASSFAAGVSTVGSIANRYTVYKNPYMTSNEILLGFKGSNFLETGAVYAPYVPLIMTPLVYDPTNFTPRRGVMTRYAKKMVRPEFYGKIYVKDLSNL